MIAIISPYTIYVIGILRIQIICFLIDLVFPD